MPRKKTKSLQRKIEPDRKYNSVLVQRLINKVMIDGKKSTAEKLVYSGMEQAAKKLKSEDPLATLEDAMKNIYPAMEVKSRRVGGANYQIPFEVKGTRKTHLALMWFVGSIRSKSGKSLDKCIAEEIVDAVNNTGTSVKVKEDTHKMAEANRAFAHFARY
jgi:small subunit ribosomal protein S7